VAKSWKTLKADVAEETLNAILARATADGLMPWDSPVLGQIGTGPENATTAAAYAGFNWVWLAMHGQRYWAGAKQWATVGATVKDGAKGVSILIPKMVTRERDGEKRPVLIGFRSGRVFSADMVTGWTPPAVVVNPDALTPNEAADAIVAAMPNRPTIDHVTVDCGSYVPALDVVRMPNRERFKSAARYYKTLTHELAHATGHASRLDRKAGMASVSGVHAYSREELVAEFAAAMLMARCGMHAETADNSAAYVAHWAKYLGENPMVIFEAAADAQKSVNYILGKVKGKAKIPAAEETAEAAVA
jgi:antirestriction protein ArdC